MQNQKQKKIPKRAQAQQSEGEPGKDKQNPRQAREERSGARAIPEKKKGLTRTEDVPKKLV